MQKTDKREKERGVRDNKWKICNEKIEKSKSKSKNKKKEPNKVELKTKLFSFTIKKFLIIKNSLWFYIFRHKIKLFNKSLGKEFCNGKRREK